MKLQNNITKKIALFLIIVVTISFVYYFLKHTEKNNNNIMSTICLVVNNHNLTTTDNNPMVSSGNRKTVSIVVAFDSEWDGYTKSAIFYTSNNDVKYEVFLSSDNTAIVPWEVLTTPGLLYIGIRGVKDDRVKTTEIIRCNIVNGATPMPTENPTLEAYEQLSTNAELSDAIDGIEQITETIINVGGSRTFKTIQDAVSSITDTGYHNRYTILVDEGKYDITNAGIQYIPIKPYVIIKGVDKAKCIISFRPSQKDASKNVFQQSVDFGDGYAEVCNFTLITENVKGGLHLDDSTWKGEIYFHDIIIDDVSSEENFDSTLDYYNYMRASVGAINLATHLEQKIHTRTTGLRS